jgi:hypothetical protein
MDTCCHAVIDYIEHEKRWECADCRVKFVSEVPGNGRHREARAEKIREAQERAWDDAVKQVMKAVRVAMTAPTGDVALPPNPYRKP